MKRLPFPLTLLLLTALLLVGSPARALPAGVQLSGGTLKVELKKPQDADPNLTLDHTFTLTIDNSSSAPATVELPFGAPGMTSESAVPVTITSVTVDEEQQLRMLVPPGQTQVTLKWSEPAFDSLKPHFGWGYVDGRLEWAFDAKLAPWVGPLDVELLLPSSVTHDQYLFTCAQVGEQRRCTRHFEPAEIMGKVAEAPGGIKLTLAETDAGTVVFAAFQVALWSFLLVLLAVWRWVDGKQDRGVKAWSAGRAVVAIPILLAIISAWAVATDGTTSLPVDGAITYPLATTGTCLVGFAMISRNGAPIRVFLSQASLLMAPPVLIGLTTLLEWEWLGTGAAVGALVTLWLWVGDEEPKRSAPPAGALPTT